MMTRGKRVRPKPVPAGRKDDGTQVERLRRVCLSIAGTVEKISHGEPTFFTPRRVFAMFANNHHNDGHVAVWLPAGPGVQDAVIEEEPHIFFRPPYVGSAGWIGVEMARIDDDRLGSLIREAFHVTAAKDPAGRPGKSTKRTRTAKRM